MHLLCCWDCLDSVLENSILKGKKGYCGFLLSTTVVVLLSAKYRVVVVLRKLMEGEKVEYSENFLQKLLVQWGIIGVQVVTFSWMTLSLVSQLVRQLLNYTTFFITLQIV